MLLDAVDSRLHGTHTPQMVRVPSTGTGSASRPSFNGGCTARHTPGENDSDPHRLDRPMFDLKTPQGEWRDPEPGYGVAGMGLLETFWAWAATTMLSSACIPKVSSSLAACAAKHCSATRKKYEHCSGCEGEKSSEEGRATVRELGDRFFALASYCRCLSKEQCQRHKIGQPVHQPFS